MTTVQAEALGRAQTGQSVRNYATILEGFMARGIPEADILPRQNVFTYQAWLALGRQVRKGEHGVKVVTVRTGTVEVKDKQTGEVTRKGFSKPWRATVFHVSQTDAVQD